MFHGDTPFDTYFRRISIAVWLSHIWLTLSHIPSRTAGARLMSSIDQCWESDTRILKPRSRNLSPITSASAMKVSTEVDPKIRTGG